MLGGKGFTKKENSRLRGSNLMDPMIFTNFIRASLKVTDALETNCSLNELDQLRLENYMSVVQMAYMEWKRRNVAPNPTNASCQFDTRNR